MGNSQVQTGEFSEKEIARGPQICDKYVIGRTLGRGMQGQVYLGLDISSIVKETVALKVIEKSELSRRALGNLEREVLLVFKLYLD
jgi:serine/threonine protein kinase